MENFCWEWDVLRHMTRHVDTGAPLPRELFDKMVAARISRADSPCCGSSSSPCSTCGCIRNLCRANGAAAAGRSQAEDRGTASTGLHRFPNNFSHILAGGYAAGYYSYKWAEVLSADAYSFFEEHGILDRKSGERFRDEILAVGGSARGGIVPRFPRARTDVDALLRHNGMTA